MDLDQHTSLIQVMSKIYHLTYHFTQIPIQQVVICFHNSVQNIFLNHCLKCTEQLTILMINPEHQNKFMSENAKLIKMCRKSSLLKLVIIESGIHFHTSAIKGLALKYQHKYKWRTSVSYLKFTKFNDRIDSSCKISIMFNSPLISPNTKIDLNIPKPPSVSTVMFEALHPKFNKREYAVSSFPAKRTLHQ